MTGPQFGDLRNLRTVVTGSSSGIGREIALEFARAGADVLIHCRSSLQAAENTAAEIRGFGQRSFVCTADFADRNQLEPFVKSAWDQLGSVDVWVNNAGADLLTGKAAAMNFADKWQTLLDVDVRSTLLLSRMTGQRMAMRQTGVILNVGWDQAAVGMAGESGELFAGSKNAIIGFTRSLALSLAPHVRVNCLAPGWIRTAWGEQAGEDWQQRVLAETPLNRWGTPLDVAHMARFLASSDASFITGQVININGGTVR